VTTILVGASKPEQIDDSVAALNHLHFSEEEKKEIREVLK
jgi:aryl-alcohol dehydrogenase-like predicted oxidoreductase